MRIATVVLAVGLALGTSACTGSDDAAAPASEETEAQSKILQPGRPGYLPAWPDGGKPAIMTRC